MYSHLSFSDVICSPTSTKCTDNDTPIHPYIQEKPDVDNSMKTCKHCGNEVPAKKIKYHRRQCKIDPTFRPYKCEICSKTFAIKCSLKGHMKIHAEKEFKCEICGKEFIRKYLYVIHMRNHTGEKPFVCTICNKAFTDNYTLRYHVRTHTGVKPHVCGVCNKSFLKKSEVMLHNFL